MDAKGIIRSGVNAAPRHLGMYADFVCAMTSERLHSKADIAQVLAWQAEENARLRAELEQERAAHAKTCDSFTEYVEEMKAERVTPPEVQALVDIVRDVSTFCISDALKQQDVARQFVALNHAPWMR